MTQHFPLRPCLLARTLNIHSALKRGIGQTRSPLESRSENLLEKWCSLRECWVLSVLISLVLESSSIPCRETNMGFFFYYSLFVWFIMRMPRDEGSFCCLHSHLILQVQERCQGRMQQAVISNLKSSNIERTKKKKKKNLIKQ